VAEGVEQLAARGPLIATPRRTDAPRSPGSSSRGRWPPLSEPVAGRTRLEVLQRPRRWRAARPEHPRPAGLARRLGEVGHRPRAVLARRPGCRRRSPALRGTGARSGVALRGPRLRPRRLSWSTTRCTGSRTSAFGQQRLEVTVTLTGFADYPRPWTCWRPVAEGHAAVGLTGPAVSGGLGVAVNHLAGLPAGRRIRSPSLPPADSQESANECRNW
jgi:hypothetical protein